MEEEQRLDEPTAAGWKLWGPYLSERQWGTVREDYSPGGTAWESFSHDAARSRAYRWGEDGIFGFSDDRQTLCLALALWNGRDPILKERLFGLTNGEGNHGEDVKELYYYLDATPTHSYLKMLYKYPQREFPYAQLVEENRRRGKDEPEFELIDTGVFDDDRYFDVFVEYAKAAPRDILMRVTVHNRGPEAAAIHVLPQLWFRNTWSWGEPGPKPGADARPARRARSSPTARALGAYQLYCEGRRALLLHRQRDQRRAGCSASTPKGTSRTPSTSTSCTGTNAAVNPEQPAPRPRPTIELGSPPAGTRPSGFACRTRPHATPVRRLRRDGRAPAARGRRVLRAAAAGDDRRSAPGPAAGAGRDDLEQAVLLLRHAPVAEGRSGAAGAARRAPARPQHDWLHLNNADMISMPDKWEYPWYAAWDLAFHTIPLALVDPEFAKDQLVLLTREWYMHPNGQLPAYEWAFGDVNPPVHAWAAWRVFQIDRKRRRRTNPGDPGDLAFLERVFHKLMLNFTWWVNRKDAEGRNIFQGGFLGLDNIGVFDRSAPLPTGGYINQADGTSWMAMYWLNLMRIALELALAQSRLRRHRHQVLRALPAHRRGDDERWQRGPRPVGRGGRLLLRRAQPAGRPDAAAEGALDGRADSAVRRRDAGAGAAARSCPQFTARLDWFFNYRPELAALVSRWNEPGRASAGCCRCCAAAA